MLSRRLLRIKAIKAVYAHLKSDADSISASEKNLVHSIEKTYHLYNQVFTIILEVKKLAENKILAGKQKHLPTYDDLNPNTKFIDNVVINKIAECEQLSVFCERNSLNWANYPELIKKIYANLVKSDYYKEYMSKESRSYVEELKFVVDFFSKELEDNELLEEVLLEQSIFWEDDLGFVLTMIVKTLQGCTEKKALKLMPMFKTQDDLEYIKSVFNKALVNKEKYMAIIERFTKNWDVDRFAFMDHVIMLTAVSELINCSTIPVKVTLDEFIEISKYYSTLSSSTFINGVLDKIVDELRAESVIVKEGRGLVE